MLYDIHCHYMPMVDDGPDTINETVEMMKIAADEGIDHIILTPHYCKPYFVTDSQKIYDGYRLVQQAVIDNGLKTRIYLGNEVHVNEDMIEWLQQGVCRTMSDSNYVLVEFSNNDPYVKLRKCVVQLVSAGYRPILAHVERYEACLDKYDNIRELIDLGAYIQVNANTFTGRSGRTAMQFAKTLVKDDLLDFVATDAHNTRERKPQMLKCAEVLEKLRDLNYIKRIMVDNPKCIIKNQEI